MRKCNTDCRKKIDIVAPDYVACQPDGRELQLLVSRIYGRNLVKF